MISVAHDALSRRQAIYAHRLFFFGGGGLYTQQGRAQSRRLHPDWAARPALIMSRAAHAVGSRKSKARPWSASKSEVSPRPCLGCAVELVCFFFFFFCHSRPSQGQGPGLVIRPGSGAACPRAPPHESTEHGRLAPVAAARTRKGPSACRIRVRGNTTYNDNDKFTNDVHVL
jgi:hypothetical protein